MKVLDVPWDGPAVERVPTLEHECALSGLRVVALPPGEVDMRYVVAPHIIDVNLNDAPYEMAVNSDRARGGLFAPDLIAWGPPQTEFRLRARNADWGVLMELDPARAEALVAEDLGGRGLPREFADYAPAPEGALLARRLIAHMRAGAPDRLFVEGLSLAVLSRALNVAGHGREAGAAPAAGGADRRVLRALDYAEAHLGEALSVAELARAAAMSPSAFARAFRAATGEAVWAHVQRRRCERAREMLLATRLPVTEVALACGFANAGHLATSLRRRYGAAPGAIRGRR